MCIYAETNKLTFKRYLHRKKLTPQNMIGQVWLVQIYCKVKRLCASVQPGEAGEDCPNRESSSWSCVLSESPEASGASWWASLLRLLNRVFLWSLKAPHPQLYFLFRRRFDFLRESMASGAFFRFRGDSSFCPAPEEFPTALSMTSRSLRSSSAKRAFCSPMIWVCSSSFWSWSWSCFCCSCTLVRSSEISRLRTVTPAPFVLTCCWSLVTSCLEGFCLEKSCMVVRAAEGPGTAEKWF